LANAVGYDFVFGKTIPAGGRLVIAKDPALILSTYGYAGALGPYTGVLSNKDDEVELHDSLGNTADKVHYRQEGLWPVAADGTGPSLELINTSVNNELPGMWRASAGNGTPGAANSQVVANPGASIDKVIHSPVVPTSAQTVTVTALVGAGNL